MYARTLIYVYLLYPFLFKAYQTTFGKSGKNKKWRVTSDFITFNRCRIRFIYQLVMQLKLHPGATENTSQRNWKYVPAQLKIRPGATENTSRCSRNYVGTWRLLRRHIVESTSRRIICNVSVRLKGQGMKNRCFMTDKASKWQTGQLSGRRPLPFLSYKWLPFSG